MIFLKQYTLHYIYKSQRDRNHTLLDYVKISTVAYEPIKSVSFTVSEIYQQHVD